jgi:hypothetical protein
MRTARFVLDGAAISITVPVNTAAVLQAAWHGGSDTGEQEQAQTGARVAATKAIRTTTRMFILDTDWREVGATLMEKNRRAAELES